MVMNKIPTVVTGAYDNKKTVRRGIFTGFINTSGTLVYYFAIWIITMIISKVSYRSYYDVGIFSAAMSYGNIFFAVAAFGVRGFQISDINHEFSEQQYYMLRILTCVGATMACVLSALSLGYRGDILFAITVYMIFKAIDAYSDLFYGYSQVNGHLEYAGYSMAAKGIIICVLFSLVLSAFQNLIAAMSSMFLSALIVNIYYDQRKARNLCGLKRSSLMVFISEIPGIKRLFIACTPLMLNSLIMPLLLAVPRLLIEKIYSSPDYATIYGPRYGTELLGIYTSVTAPTVLISTFVSAAALPLIPASTRAWQARNKGRVMAFVFFPVIAVALCCAAGMPLVLHFGGDILRILYTAKISGYVELLVIAVITSSILACVILCNNILIAMRRMKAMLVFAIAACVTVIMFSVPVIKLWGMYGAAYTLGLAYSIELLLQLGYICYYIFYKRK